jgi:hypothetical protein
MRGSLSPEAREPSVLNANRVIILRKLLSNLRPTPQPAVANSYDHHPITTSLLGLVQRR